MFRKLSRFKHFQCQVGSNSTDPNRCLVPAEEVFSSHAATSTDMLCEATSTQQNRKKKDTFLGHFQTHRIHGTICIFYQHLLVDFYGFHVGKYTIHGSNMILCVQLPKKKAKKRTRKFHWLAVWDPGTFNGSAWGVLSTALCLLGW